MTYSPGGGSGQIATNSDVALNNPADKQVLAYDGALAKWTNASSTPIIKLTKADYDAIVTKSADAIYVISDTPGSMSLNGSLAVYFGTEIADQVYIGDQLVWSTSSVEQPTIPPTEETPPSSSDELIVNPTFDTDITSWNAGANTTLAHETTGTQAGTGALRMTAVAAGEVKTWSEKFAVDPSKLYDFTAYVKAGSAGRSTGLQIDWYSANTGGYIASSHHYAGSTTSWEERKVIGVKPPSNAVSASVAIALSNAVAGEAHYVDSITAREAGAATPPSGTILWRPNLTEGISCFKATGTAIAGGSTATFPTVAHSSDPSGRVFRASIPANTNYDGVKILSWFDSVSVPEQDEIYFSYDLRIPSSVNMRAEGSATSKQAWGIGGLPRSQSIWNVSSGGNKRIDSWSYRFCTIPANYLRWRIGSHPFTFVVYLYAVKAGGQTLKQYGIEIPFKVNVTGEYYQPPLDQWINLQGRVRVNTNGVADGIAEAWADGVKMVSLSDVEWNASGYRQKANIVINNTFFNSKVATPATFDHQNLMLKSAP